jgi:SAM-dependent methyltransferase
MEKANEKKAVPAKFPHKGRAGYLARKKLAEEGASRGSLGGAVRDDKKTITDKSKTGWGKVAQWYHETVEDRASYQKDLIMPNLLRLIDIKPGVKILDLGCGEGLFTRRFAKAGAEVTAIDVALQLIEIAKREAEIKGLQENTTSLQSGLKEREQRVQELEKLLQENERKSNELKK